MTFRLVFLTLLDRQTILEEFEWYNSLKRIVTKENKKLWSTIKALYLTFRDWVIYLGYSLKYNALRVLHTFFVFLLYIRRILQNLKTAHLFSLFKHEQHEILNESLTKCFLAFYLSSYILINKASSFMSYFVTFFSDLPLLCQLGRVIKAVFSL